jgi:hypothetical protein
MSVCCFYLHIEGAKILFSQQSQIKGSDIMPNQKLLYFCINTVEVNTFTNKKKKHYENRSIIACWSA